MSRGQILIVLKWGTYLTVLRQKGTFPLFLSAMPLIDRLPVKVKDNAKILAGVTRSQVSAASASPRSSTQTCTARERLSWRIREASILDISHFALGAEL